MIPTPRPSKALTLLVVALGLIGAALIMRMAKMVDEGIHPSSSYPECWDCKEKGVRSEMHPVTRPDGSLWWACGCSRIIRASNPHLWCESAKWGVVPVYVFYWEWEKIKASRPVDRAVD